MHPGRRRLRLLQTLQCPAFHALNRRFRGIRFLKLSDGPSCSRDMMRCRCRHAHWSATICHRSKSHGQFFRIFNPITMRRIKQHTLEGACDYNMVFLGSITRIHSDCSLEGFAPTADADLHTFHEITTDGHRGLTIPPFFSCMLFEGYFLR